MTKASKNQSVVDFIKPGDLVFDVRHGGGVDLRAAGLDVVEVAPGDHVDAFEAGRSGDVAKLAAVVERFAHR